MRTKAYEHEQTWHDDFWYFCEGDAFYTYLEQVYAYMGAKPGKLWRLDL